MKLLLSLSFPEIVPDTDFDLDDPEVRKDLLKHLMAKKSCVKVGEYNDLPFYHTGDQDGYWFLTDVAVTDIYYCCRYTSTVVRGSSKSKAVTQLAVWRTQDYATYKLLKIAALVLFKRLLPTYGIVMSDGQHTRAGKRFWIGRIVDALHRGLYCYVYNQNTRELTQIRAEKELADLEQEVWAPAPSPKHRAMRLVISQTRLGE